MKKIRNRRGITLVELLIVVALMAIMLGIAVPNLLEHSRQMKLKELNENARAVAVAVQSKLYGMRNAGTSKDSSYSALNTTAAFTAEIIPTSKTGEEDEAETVSYLSNFVWADDAEVGDGGTSERVPIPEDEKKERVRFGTSMVLSGALTDLELLQKGKIAVFFKPETADVLEVFYSEKEYNITEIIQLLEFNLLTQDYLDQREIGHYYGYGVEEPERLEGMPLFTCNWIWDDELRLQIKMLTEPTEELRDKKLGLEVYLRFPGLENSNKETEEMMIYAEGIFGNDYTATEHIQNDYAYPENLKIFQTIKKDTPLTFQDIAKNNYTLNFALDSMVTNKAGWGSMKKYLRHETTPDAISIANDVLFPRDSIDFWTDCTQNPYLTVWFRQHASKDEGHPYTDDSTMSQQLFDAVSKYVGDNASRTPTNFVKVDARISLRVRLYALADDGNTLCGHDDKHPNSCVDYLRKADDTIKAVDIISHSINPYYYLLTSKNTEVALTSIRDFSNLRYIFQSDDNSIQIARLHSDISGQQFFSKLTNVRDGLVTKLETLGRMDEKEKVKNNWPDGASRDGCAVNPMYINNKNEKKGKEYGFLLSGTKPGGGSYKISNIAAGVENWDLGGFFGFARNCTFENIDIVNSGSWRNGYLRSLIKEDSEKEKITGFEIDWRGGVTGSLVGVAANCKFNNVRVYIDPDNQLKNGTQVATNISYDRLSGVLVGGLVGLAIGDSDQADQNEGKTTFENCAASIITSSELLYPAANCVYAGGLIGATLGNVEISNSYGASQVGGYYSGGLIGVTVAGGTFKYDDDHSLNHDTAVTIKDGQTTVKNSFAAGIISRQTRVGGGLIADVNGESNSSDALSVENCYSACWWEAFPPVAYGTFKGDDKNFYVVQRILSVPVGMTVEAVFECTGDVFSLQGDSIKCGKACFTVSDLEKGLDFPTSSAIWTNQKGTLRWADAENKLQPPDEFKDKTYPFLMPVGNDSFWGVWVRYYNDKTTEGTGTGKTEPEPEFSAKLLRFVVTYYWATWNSRLIELGGIEPIELTIKDGKLEFIGKEIIQDSGMYKDAEADGKHKYFWVNATDDTVMQGIDGVTKVTVVDNDKFKFEGPKFYDPGFDPIEGYNFEIDKCEDVDHGINLGDTTLGWDFYGFYFLADYEGVQVHTTVTKEDGTQEVVQVESKSEGKKYYVKFETTGVKIPDGKKAYKNGDYIYVNKEKFMNAVGYDNGHTLSKEGAHLVWNSSHGCFEVLDKDEIIGSNGERETKS